MNKAVMEGHIVHGMARALYVIAYQLWAIEVDPPPELRPGSTWDEVAPDTADSRLAGIHAARDVEEAVAKENPGLGEYPFLAMLEVAWAEMDPDARRYYRDENLAVEFGEQLAYVCVGMQDPGLLTQFTLPILHVELDDDGREMSWEDRGWNAPLQGPTVNPAQQWPSSTVQSLLFDIHRYTEKQAKRWAQDHGFKYGAVDTTANYHRLRQFEPRHGQPCRTIEFGHGIQAIVCATSNPAGKPLGIEVLVLEDDPKIQNGIARMVRSFLTNPHIIFADNVGAAIADLEVHQFGLVISDVNVRGARTGIDLFRHVQQQYPGLVDRFVFFTDNVEAKGVHYRYLEKGGATAEDLKQATRAPARGTVAPPTPAPRAPMTLADLAQAVNGVLPTVQEMEGPSGLPMGRFGDGVFVAAAWRALERQPGFRAMTLEMFKRRLVEANQQSLVDLGRMDAQGEVDPEELEESEIVDRGARFHVIKDRSASRGRARGAMTLPDFADAVNELASQVRPETGHQGKPRGRYGAKKVFVAAIWRAAQQDPRFRGMTREQFNDMLIRAQRESRVDMARADLVGAMDSAEVADSEIVYRDQAGRPIASFHFVADPSAQEPWER